MKPDDLAARGVKVRALEWYQIDRAFTSVSGREIGRQITGAHGHFGMSYYIYESPADGIHVAGTSSFSCYHQPSVEAAKAAAQTDYETRCAEVLEVSDDH